MAGIKTTGCGGRIIDNHVTNNLFGILLDGTTSTLGALANTVSINTIDLNAQSGIALGLSACMVQHNLISNNIITDNCIEADNTYSALSIAGQYAIRNFVRGNEIINTAQTYKPLYGIYLDANCINNTILNNECSAGSTINMNLP